MKTEIKANGVRKRDRNVGMWTVQMNLVDVIEPLIWF